MERVVAEELRWIALSIGAGSLLGLLYDVQHALRSPLVRWQQKLWDNLFVLSAAIWLFGLCLRFHGEVRLSFFIFLAAGCLLYGLTLRRGARRGLEYVEKWERSILEKVRSIWEKILFFTKKGYAKLKKTFTIKGRRQKRPERREKERTDEQGSTALGAVLSADAHSVRTTYAAERVGGKRERGTPSAGAESGE